MKYYFKSDYFTYLHPSKAPCTIGELKGADYDEAVANTALLKPDRSLFETAVYESDDRIPARQVGTLIVFPEMDECDMSVMRAFIEDTFRAAESELAEEYNDETDPTMFWKIGWGGEHFAARGVNCKTGETFGSSSLSLYIAGCMDTTADYLVETAIDMMYIESAKHDRKVVNGGDRIGFDRFRTFLVYSFGSKRFYQFGYREKELYHRQQSERRRRLRNDIVTYALLNAGSHSRC